MIFIYIFLVRIYFMVIFNIKGGMNLERRGKCGIYLVVSCFYSIVILWYFLEYVVFEFFYEYDLVVVLNIGIEVYYYSCMLVVWIFVFFLLLLVSEKRWFMDEG